MPYLIPKPKTRVPIPGTRQALPAAGAEIQLTTYWRRRIADSDVTVRSDAAAAVAAAVPSAAAAPATTPTITPTLVKS